MKNDNPLSSVTTCTLHTVLYSKINTSNKRILPACRSQDGKNLDFHLGFAVHYINISDCPFCHKKSVKDFWHSSIADSTLDVIVMLHRPTKNAPFL